MKFHTLILTTVSTHNKSLWNKFPQNKSLGTNFLRTNHFYAQPFFHLHLLDVMFQIQGENYHLMGSLKPLESESAKFVKFTL